MCVGTMSHELRGRSLGHYHNRKVFTSFNNVVIGEGARLESTVVFDYARIGEQVVLRNCVVGENCTIGRSSMLSNAVVGDQESVKEGTVLDNSMVWTQPVPKGYPDKQIGNVIGE